MQHFDCSNSRWQEENNNDDDNNNNNESRNGISGKKQRTEIMQTRVCTAKHTFVRESVPLQQARFPALSEPLLENNLYRDH
jgi:hypothetical protein